MRVGAIIQARALTRLPGKILKNFLMEMVLLKMGNLN